MASEDWRVGSRISHWSELRRRSPEGLEDYASRLTRTLNAHMIHSVGSSSHASPRSTTGSSGCSGLAWPSRFSHFEFRSARHALGRGFGLCSQVLARAGGPPVESRRADGDRWPRRSRRGHGTSRPAAAGSCSTPTSVSRCRCPSMRFERSRIDRARLLRGLLEGGRCRLERAFAGSHDVRRRPDARDRRWCVAERALFALKWLIPVVFTLVGLGLLLRGE